VLEALILAGLGVVACRLRLVFWVPYFAWPFISLERQLIFGDSSR
jgi:hypothetical protein